MITPQLAAEFRGGLHRTTCRHGWRMTRKGGPCPEFMPPAPEGRKLGPGYGAGLALAPRPRPAGASAGRNMPAGGPLFRPGRAAEPPAASASSMPGAAYRKAQRGQYPPPQGDDAAVSACRARRLAGDRSPGRRAIGGSPRGDPLHGLDGVVETRARHSAPSPGQFCTHDRCHRDIQARHPRTARAATGGNAGRNLPPRSREQPAQSPDTTAPGFQGSAAAPGVTARNDQT